ncbi:maltose alpha-D-glucosyltransferase [Fibrella aestuarina BUZ 2]|uniref:Maltokinase n=1 Tax=Fibrella aestuarina BUZ 2 TaxID=1166018 RepID=I0K7Q6_9BACT|nr:maltose alpha-D-glucosyltransferase [Fibrella aestuarina]CCH00159.1 maltose alpha-D-glucosyltransferase [Fibrella aestuarina BUZ 2]
MLSFLTSTQPWSTFLDDTDAHQQLTETILLPYVNTCRWFAGKARQQTGIHISAMLALPGTGQQPFYLLILDAHYADGEPEQYLLPLALVADLTDVPDKGVLTEARFSDMPGTLVDAIYVAGFRDALFKHIAANDSVTQPGNSASGSSASGTLAFQRGRGLIDAEAGATLTSRVLPVDSSNSALVFGYALPSQPSGELFFLKLYRKLFEQTNPEVEMVAFLTETGGFGAIPAYAGRFTWQRTNAAGPQPDITLGMMQRMVPNDKDSWAMTGDYLNDFLYAVPNRLFAVKEDVFEKVALLGQRTAEMHLALYAKTDDPAFQSEPFTDEYRRFLTGRFTDLLDRRYDLLVNNYSRLDAQAQRLAWVFMEAKEMIDDFVADFQTRWLGSCRIRVHGDYHLGQVLAVGDHTGHRDYVIIDFEGEPESTITDRKIKHSPLKDVAGMIRSYHYAVSAKLFNSVETEGIDPEKLQIVSDRWYKLIRDTYLDAYLGTFGSPHPMFYDNGEINYLLLIYLLEKAVYELGYEISYRPTWVKIPLKGIVDVIREIEKLQPGGHHRQMASAPLHLV